MTIIIGLGNPSKKYEQTRHNTGFMAVDFIANKLELAWQENKKLKSIIAKNHELILVKPQTYMNNSGQAVRAILDYYKIIPKKFGLFATPDSNLSDRLIVIHDDIDIELGQYKISVNASSAGHNGVQSIINHVKTKNFKRVRVGIKNKVGTKIPTEKLVMQNFSPEELVIIKKQLAAIADKLL